MPGPQYSGLLRPQQVSICKRQPIPGIRFASIATPAAVVPLGFELFIATGMIEVMVGIQDMRQSLALAAKAWLIGATSDIYRGRCTSFRVMQNP